MARRSRGSDRWLPEHFTELVPEMAQTLLKPDGNALIKPLQSAGFQEFVASARRAFRQEVAVLKHTYWPPAGGWCSVPIDAKSVPVPRFICNTVNRVE
jgi:hypothetical protein